MTPSKTLTLSLILFLFLGFSEKTKMDDWQLKKFENGISIYTRTTEGSSYKELKATLQINSSLSSILALLNDVESFPVWMYKCEQSKLLKKDSDQNMIRYLSFYAPWPVDKRDIVGEVTNYQDSKTKIVYQEIKSKPDYIPFEEDYVRILEFHAIWMMKPLKKGVVEIEYLLVAKPGGNIPAWLSNLVVIDGPFETLSNLKNKVLEKKYQQTKYSFIIEPY